MKIILFSQTLSASSSKVEQAFLVMKLFRTDKRNRVSDESLETLMCLCQEFDSLNKIIIPRKMVDLFLDIRSIIKDRKNRKKSCSPVKGKDLNLEEFQHVNLFSRESSHFLTSCGRSLFPRRRNEDQNN